MKKILTLIILLSALFACSDKNNDLLKNTRLGRKEKVEKLLQNKNININIQDEQGKTPLILSLQKGYIEIFDLLMTKEVNPNIPDNNGDTPLIEAARTGKVRVVKDLINKGANVNYLSHTDGITALFAAVSNHNTSVSEILLENSANPNIKRVEGRMNTLHVASMLGYEDIVGLLLKYKADVNAKDSNGNTALLLAQKGNHPKVIALLQGRTNKSQSSLLQACETGNIKLVEQLLKDKANPNISKNNGVTPLFLASQNGHVEVVKLLLQYGANPNLTKDNGVTPLWIASQNGQNLVVDILLKNKANPNICREKDKVSPLWIASQEGYTGIVESLLNANADVTLKNSSKLSAIDIASQRGHKDIVQLLHKKGLPYPVAVVYSFGV